MVEMEMVQLETDGKLFQLQFPPTPNNNNSGDSHSHTHFSFGTENTCENVTNLQNTLHKATRQPALGEESANT